MNSEKRFSKGIERLINPIDVGSMHFIYEFNRLLPRSIQDKLMKSSIKESPYMGFVVEPYAYFLCHEITNIEQAQSLLPVGFKLVKTKIFVDDEPRYYVIFGCTSVHTSAFWGARMEFYIIAEDEATGLLSWVIIDYSSNTISQDPKNGLRQPTASHALITTTHRGNIFVDFQDDSSDRKLVFGSDIKSGKMAKLDQRLWLEGNLSICYGKELSMGKPEPFSLKFDPLEVEEALNIPLDDIVIEANTWFPGLYNPVPAVLACFPYAQHFLSDSPGHTSALRNESELVSAVELVDFDKIKVFSTKGFKKMIFVGMGVSSVVTLILLLLLLVK